MGKPFQLPQERAALHPDYLRLFGPIPPEQVMQPVDPLCSSRDDGSLGPPYPHFRDPNEGAAGHFSAQELSQFLAASNHPSAASLASIADLRAWHVGKGHVPAEDARHGPLYFKIKSDNAWRDALRARSPEQRRKLLIIAVSILIAMIDAEDFTTRQQEPTP